MQVDAAIDGLHVKLPSARRARLRLGLHLVLGARRIDLLVVISRHAGDLAQVAEGVRHVVYDPTQRPSWWCLRFWIHRLFCNRNTPVEIRTLLSIVKVLRCRAVISSDAYRVLLNAESYLKSTRLYFVQHGTYLNSEHKSKVLGKVVVERKSKITLFSIGEFDRVNYDRAGIRPDRVIPVGTLKNSAYCLGLAAQTNRRPKKSFDLCIVEKGINPHPDSQFGELRLDTWHHILALLNHYCNQSSPRVIVALSNSAKPSLVLQWIRQHLHYEFEVSNPDDSFATYRVVDESELTIGISITVLCEALSRNKKVLSVDFSDHSIFGLPGNGIEQLRSPSQETFEERVNTLRAIDWSTYRSRLSSETRLLLGPDPQSGIPIINQTLRTDLATNC